MILHHTAIRHRGGAVRVARLLQADQGARGLAARLAYEAEENDPEALAGHGAPPPQQDAFVHPEDMRAELALLPPGAILHLHTSTDWPALVSGLAGVAESAEQAGSGGSAFPRLVLTLHDAGALTGGCAYPLDCPHFGPLAETGGCAEPCPRNFPKARARQAVQLAALRALAPLAVSPSRWLAGLWRQLLPELPVKVIPNGIPWPALAELPGKALARAALGVPPLARVALFAAHGGARAGYKSGPLWGRYWEAVAGRVRAQGGEAPLRAFAVGGDEAAEGPQGLTVWPYVDREKLLLLMRAADALVYPSLADNHPLVLLEAAACELPCAAYAVGGVPEIVIHGETGLLSPCTGAATDTDGLVQAAAGLLLNPALARRLGRAARERGEKRFSAGRMAADYARLVA